MMSFFQSIFDQRLSTSAVPIALLVWLIQKWWSTRSRKLDETRLAVMYLNEIKHEVETGTERLRKLYCNGGKPKLEFGSYHPKMPTACWTGVRAILPDDVFRRICFVASYGGKSETIKDLRWHLKNYYTVICEYGNKLLLEENGLNSEFERKVVREHLDGAKMVERLLDETCQMMEENLKRFIWPR